MTSPYDAVAEWYDAWVGTVEEDPYFAAVQTLMGEVAGQRVCDLACGQGRVARYLADQGASVLGIDLSRELLAMARRYETSQPRGIEYLYADAQRLDGVPTAVFDGVVCHMALMDIPDLASTVRGVARILRPGGWFIFSILHPCFHTAHSSEMELPEGTVRTIGRYFAEGYWRSATRSGPPGKVGAYHRMLSTYLNTLAQAGLILERADEPHEGDGSSPAPSFAGSSRPVWREVPAVLVARCRKAAIPNERPER